MTPRPVYVTLTADTTRLTAALTQLAETMRTRAPAFRAFLTRVDTWDRNHPGPLPIDGYAYRRRRQARRRRR